jgi:hypothetical protein
MYHRMEKLAPAEKTRHRRVPMREWAEDNRLLNGYPGGGKVELVACTGRRWR